MPTPTTYEDLLDLLLRNDPKFIAEFPDFDRENRQHVIAGIVWLHQQSKNENPRALFVDADLTFEILESFATFTNRALRMRMRLLRVAIQHEDDKEAGRLIRSFDEPLAKGVEVKFTAKQEPLRGLKLTLHETRFDTEGAPSIYTQ